MYNKNINSKAYNRIWQALKKENMSRQIKKMCFEKNQLAWHILYKKKRKEMGQKTEG